MPLIAGVLWDATGIALSAFVLGLVGAATTAGWPCACAKPSGVVSPAAGDG